MGFASWITPGRIVAVSPGHQITNRLSCVTATAMLSLGASQTRLICPATTAPLPASASARYLTGQELS